MGSPAAKAGIAAGDRLVAINGRAVDREKLGVFALTPMRFGTAPFRVTVLRGDVGSEINISPEAD